MLAKRLSGQFCLPTISGPQKGWWVLPSGNLKTLNKYIIEEHFQIDGFHMVRNLVRQVDWLAKIDLEMLNFLIPVHLCHQKFLEGQVCTNFSALLSCVPRVVMKMIFLRERGIEVIYFDDLLIISSSPEILSAQINLIWDWFQTLRLIINKTKSQLTPTHEIVFLGFHLSLTISLPQEKMKKIKQDAVHLLQKPQVSIQELAIFVGKTTAASQAIRVAPLLHRQLQAQINREIPQAQSKVEVQHGYHQKVALTTEARAEL